MAPPPAAPSSKKRRQRMILIGAAAAGLIVLLYMRSRSNAAAPANATTATDAQAVPVAGASNGAGGAGTFADNGANAGALGDAVTNGLATINNNNAQALQGISDALNAQASAFQQWQSMTTPSSPAAAAGQPLTININPLGGARGGTKAGSNTKHVAPPKLTAPGAYRAPSGPRKPDAPGGYRSVGLGRGNWEYVPIPRTGHGGGKKPTRRKR